MQGHGRETVLLQVVGQAVALDLRAGKHDGLVDGGIAQPMVQQAALVLGVVGPVTAPAGCWRAFPAGCRSDASAPLAPLSCITRMASCWIRGETWR